MALLGSLALMLALLLSLYGAVAGWRSARRPTRQTTLGADGALWAVAGLATLASLSLFYLLVTRDYQIAYVHQHVSVHLPLAYTLSAFWAGREGSLLLWFWLLSLLAALVTRDLQASREARPYMLAILALVEAFFALAIIATHNPFAMHATRPAEGIGMLPLLQNPGMIVHPPVLFLGYAGYTVPFAFGMAALMSKQLDSRWLEPVRRWSLLAWLALSCGILIGAWWSYVELGWGGYWAWDPVENASLIPWLFGTAFLHSSIVEQRRGMQRAWNFALPTLAFVCCLFATLVTRGGIIISDLHGFASTIQPIAYLLLTAIAASLLGAIGLVYSRRSLLEGRREIQSFVSRESSFLLVNLLFSGAALSVLLGTAFPALARALSGTLVGFHSSFYNRTVGPMLLAVIFVMGACPVLGWERLAPRGLRNLLVPAFAAAVTIVALFILGAREALPLSAAGISSFVVFSLANIVARDVAARRRSTRERWLRSFWKMATQARRRYGAYVVHLAIILISIGITGSTAYKQELLASLSKGDSTSLGDYTIQYEDLAMEARDAEPVSYQSRIRFATTLGVYRGRSRIDTVVAEKNYHPAVDSPWVTEVAIHSTLKEDLYIVLANLDETGLASFQIVINPLVNWIWVGGGMLLLGTLLAAWPQTRKRPEQVTGT